MRHQPNPASVIALYAIMIAMLVMVQRARKHPVNSTLEAKQRARPILITWLDPVACVIVIGSIFWALATTDALHALAALAGALCAVPIGVARANTQYVRVIPYARLVVFRRSGLEYALLALLVGLRLAENAIDSIRSGPLTLLLTALVSLAVVESIARSAWITVKFRRDVLATNSSSVE